jgi:hypothetical protein
MTSRFDFSSVNDTNRPLKRRRVSGDTPEHHVRRPQIPARPIHESIETTRSAVDTTTARLIQLLKPEPDTEKEPSTLDDKPSVNESSTSKNIAKKAFVSMILPFYKFAKMVAGSTNLSLAQMWPPEKLGAPQFTKKRLQYDTWDALYETMIEEYGYSEKAIIDALYGSTDWKDLSVQMAFDIFSGDLGTAVSTALDVVHSKNPRIHVCDLVGAPTTAEDVWVRFYQLTANVLRQSKYNMPTRYLPESLKGALIIEREKLTTWFENVDYFQGRLVNIKTYDPTTWRRNVIAAQWTPPMDASRVKVLNSGVPKRVASKALTSNAPHAPLKTTLKTLPGSSNE